jgi:hypothetical protein
MIRSQVQFSEEQLEKLRADAARLNVSVSEVVRRAVDAWVRQGNVPSPSILRQRAIAAAGRFSSGNDIAERHDEYLADAYRS